MGEEERREHRQALGWNPSIPAPLTAWIGRESELRAVRDTLRRSRLVTLTGPAGVGKTRMATELGHRHIRQRPEGVWLVDLASVTAAEDVAAATMRALDVRGAVGEALTDVVRRYLADRDALLLLDNCEHIIGACAEFAATLLGSSPNLRILATSREPLGVAGEAVWRLQPLFPEHSYRLFVERARDRNPELVPDHETEAAIRDICARVDHLPLGIELAAARISIMSPEEVVASLEGHLGELSRQRRSAPAHHRSVRAAVEWSYTLLDVGEQAAFRSLAVFVGGFHADSAAAVAPGMTLEMLAGLVDKSLITVLPDRQRPTRYRLLETMREYAAEQLVTANEVAAARARHLRHFSTIGIPAEEGWMSARVISWLQERAADYGNVRAALEWGAAAEPCVALRLLVETKDLFFMLGQADGWRLAELVLQRCPERSRYRAEGKIAAGHFAFLLGDVPTAIRHVTEAVVMSVALDQRGVEGTARWFLGLHQMMAGTPDEARAHLAAARAIQQETDDLLGEARSTAALGLTFLMDEPGHARALLEAALAIGEAVQDGWSQGQANLYLGILAESSAETQAASSYFRGAVECLQPYRDSTLLPMALVGQAAVMAPRDPKTALRVLAAASSLRARNGGEFAPFFRAFAERARARAAQTVAGGTDRLWQDGSRLTLDEAIALAFGTTRPRISPVHGVSQRELDVVRLVAEGLSNKEIASRLHLSVRTVESHVRHALTKTGLVNRTQLATWAHERGEGRESVANPQSH